MNCGPLSVQGEYVVNSIDRNSGGGSDWSGWYGFVSYFLTGEHRPYRRDRGAYSGVAPISKFSDSASGAVELAAHYASLDLSGSGNTTTTASGELEDVTLGANWYLNYNTRMMFNYIHADLEGVCVSDALAIRLQVFF